MAHRKAGGSTRLGRDSISKRLGVKLFGEQKASSGNVIIRQRGTKFRVGGNVKMGKDNTLYAKISGVVKFAKRKRKGFDGRTKRTVLVSIEGSDK